MEIKYKIPDRWTKKFNKYDVIPFIKDNANLAISEERGRINRGVYRERPINDYEELKA